MENISLLKKQFTCVNCDFITFNKKDYKRHLQTEKHIKQIEFFGTFYPVRFKKIRHIKYSNTCEIGKEIICSKPKETKHPLSQDIHKCTCSKQYKTASGLWKHKKTCEFVTCTANDNSDKTKETKNTPKFDENALSAFMTIIKQNQELKNLMIQQAQEQQKYNQYIQNHNKELQTQLLELITEGRNNNEKLSASYL